MAQVGELELVGGVGGLVVGSFLNVVAHRVPRGESPWSPRRSYCPACRAAISARDNVPVVSYLLLRGRCRACRARIPFRYPLVELATGGLFVWSLARWGATLAGLEAILLGSFLLTLGVVDWETGRLPDALVGVGAACALAIGVVQAWSSGDWAVLKSRLLAGGTGVASLGLVRVVGSRLARREAMGRGDVKFLGAIGLFLGAWQRVLLTVGLSALVGSVVGTAVLLVRGRGGSRAIPYGPFLALAAWVAHVWGAPVLSAMALGR
jgi:leader peptidase (prepilin peptidase)/N-methyltransferase